MSEENLPPLICTPPGLYRHYKGGEYEVLGVVRHSESLAPMVLYRPLYNATSLWVRPYAMFLEQIDVDGVKVPRFSLVQAMASPGGPLAAGPPSSSEHPST